MSPSALVVTSVHPADDPRIRHKSIDTLVDDGWTVTYACPDPGPQDSVRMRVLLLTGSRLARSFQALWAMFRIRTDVVAIHDPELLLGAVPLAMMRGKATVVFDLHENLPAQLRTRSGTPLLLRRLTSLLAATVLKIAERVMTITLAERGYLRLFRREHPVFENLPVSQTLPIRTPDASGVVYVGDITRERGAVLLLEAVARVPDVALTLIGRCQRELAEELEARARDLDVDLTLPGFLAYGEAWELASSSLVGVSPLLDLPNYRYSLPTKIYEYRSVGLVAVASDLPGSASAVDGSAAARTFKAGSVDDLARVLQEVLTDEVLHQHAVEEAPGVRAASRWDSRGFGAFYRSLLTSSR